MQANALIPILEGLVGSGLRGAANLNGRQAINTWLEGMKTIMRSTGVRDATDWNIAVDDDVVAAAGDLVAAGGTVYGVLYDYIYDVSTDNLIVVVANVTHTLTVTEDVGVSAEGGTAETGALIQFVLPNAVDGNTPQFWGATFPQGLVFTESLFMSAIGDETAVVTALDVRCAVVYRVAEIRAS
jgi:hypothetical protein